MHLMIAYASALAEPARAALGTLALPQLEALLKRMAPAERQDGDEYDLAMPHERALARAWGWTADDGQQPWAALAAADDGLVVGDAAVGLLTPVHWRVGSDQVSLVDPEGLALADDESRALAEAVAGLLAEDGWGLRYGAPLRWYALHESLAGLPTASLDRVIGRGVDLWLADDTRLRQLRRLQVEVQMLLHRHPVNEAREARGDLPVNSFWLSGCGRALPVPARDAVTLDLRLRVPVLAGDWAGWAEAWHALDAGPVTRLREALDAGTDVRLTLAGERSAATWAPRPGGLWRRLVGGFASLPVQPVLEAL